MVRKPSRIAADALRLLPRKRISRLIGSVAAVEAPQAVVDRVVDGFVRIYGVDLGEAQIPEQGFESFDAFFTRHLRHGARPIDEDPAAIVSPADGKLEDFGPIDLGATLTVKGRLYDVVDLIGDAGAGARYEGGSYFIVYLSPRDYHRVHAPLGGAVERTRYVPGTLFPVNALGTEHIPRLFARNERVAVVQRTETHGEVTTVMVGAIGVGRIGLAFDDLETNRGHSPGAREYGGGGPRVEKGEEIGVFHLGSTVVVFVGPDAPVEFEVRRGDPVRMGQAVARTVGRERG